MQREKRKFSHNLVHNIVEVHNVLVETQLPISKPKPGILYCKRSIEVASRVVQGLKT